MKEFIHEHVQYLFVIVEYILKSDIQIYYKKNMGNDSSKPQAAVENVPQPAKSQKVVGGMYETKSEVYQGIETIDPFVLKRASQISYTPDIVISCSDLPDTHKMAVDYFNKIASRINSNEQQIATRIKKQLEEYIELSSKLEKRQDELNVRLAKLLGLFRQLDEEVKTVTESLKTTIEQADALAAQIDPSFMKFNEYRNQ